jgi:D-amino-acid dehydrogenase
MRRHIQGDGKSWFVERPPQNAGHLVEAVDERVAMDVKVIGCGTDTFIRMRPRADADLLRWGWRFLRECTPSRSRANTLAKLALAGYSQRLTDELAHREGLQFWHTGSGVLYLYREESELRVAARNSALLREHGRHQRLLDANQITAVEPALRHSRTVRRCHP